MSRYLEGDGMRRDKKLDTRYTVTMALLVSVAMICSYVESLIPPLVAVPGVKLGLANAVTLMCLYLVGTGSAVTVSLFRIGLSALLFGNPVSFIYSLAGGALSLVGSVLLKKSGLFSPVGVSAVSGVLHNVGQMIAVSFVMSNAALMGYLPVLLISGTIAGVCVGLVSGFVIARLRGVIKK